MDSDTTFALTTYGLTAAGVAGSILFFHPHPKPPPTPQCFQDSNCSVGYVCVNGVCVTCASADESCSAQCPQGVCPTGYICTNGGVCTVQGSCTVNSDCPVGSVCSNNVCVTCASVNAPCSSQCPQGVCASGETCVQGVCETPAPTCASGISCSSTGTCPCGYACINGCCVSQCAADLLCCNTTCPVGYTCGPYGCCIKVTEKCSGSCTAPSQCATGCTCSGGTCVPATGTCSGTCTTNSDCTEGCECLSGACSPLPRAFC